ALLLKVVRVFVLGVLSDSTGGKAARRCRSCCCCCSYSPLGAPSLRCGRNGKSFDGWSPQAGSYPRCPEAALFVWERGMFFCPFTPPTPDSTEVPGPNPTQTRDG
ncbi:unnamed protein product, partial [Ectocarpus sp. 6 AP-2014]